MPLYLFLSFRISSMEVYSGLSNNFSNSFRLSRTMAIFNNEESDISPVRSKRKSASAAAVLIML